MLYSYLIYQIIMYIRRFPINHSYMPRLFIKPKYLIVFLLGITGFTVAAQQKENAALIKTYRHIKDKDSSDRYAQELLEIAHKKNDPGFEAQILYAHSMIVYKRGDIAGALDLARQSNKLATPADSVTYTKSATMIAYMLNQHGENLEALKVAFEILRKADAHGWKRQGVDCRNCIADIFRLMGDPQKALPYALQAMQDAKSLKDTALYIYSLTTLSNTYSNKPIDSPANVIIATSYLETVLNPPYVAKLSQFDKAGYLSNLGRLYEKQHQFDKAERTLLQSLEISTNGKFLKFQQHALNELTTIQTDIGQYQRAIDYGKQALAVIPYTQSDRKQVRNIYHQFSRAYAGLKDYENALLYNKKVQTIDSNINTEEKIKVGADLDAKYKADKRLILAAEKEREATIQRNYIVVIALILLLVAFAAYRWMADKKKKEADLMSERHRQLARMDAMKTRFFANISHELRTPLTLIMGPAEHLKTEGLDQTQQGYLQTIIRNSRKLLNMVNELLDLGKIEAGTLSVKLKSVDLGWFISIIYQGFASLAAYKNISYTLVNEIPAKLYVQLDADKFEKILSNLVSNAIKFTPTNGVVTITAKISQGMIEITVKDTGRGIYPEDLPLVFDRYYQGRQEEGSSEGGTGIGLAIVKEFVNLMGGTIAAESRLNAGSVFKVTLPELPVAGDTVLDYPVPERYAATETSGNGQGDKLVLLVEDHVEMAQYISSVIKPVYRVNLANNGKEALDQLKSMPVLPDLIISDVMMPEMDGFTLLDHLKKSELLCRIPVIMLTALADTDNRLKALNIGVDDYITKPFLSSELITRTVNLIRNSESRLNFSSQEEQEFAEIAQEDSHAEETEDLEVDEYVSPADLHWLAEVESVVKKHIGKTDLNLMSISYEMAISERQLFRRIKSITGLTPNKYIRSIRLQIAREGIASGKYRTIAEISYLSGFETPAYFAKLFKEHYGRDVNELL